MEMSAFEPVRFGTAQSRWIVAAAALGSGVAFLDGTVVNVALPAIGRTFRSDLGGLQWVLTGYLLTLGSLLVLGGSLGDLYGRKRVFQWGLVGFTGASMLCGLAPNIAVLVAARFLQGIAGAALVPGSLAMISAIYAPADRGAAIGAWSGLTGIATAVGPFLGGWLIDVASWRWVFIINLPIATAAVLISQRHVPESRDDSAGRRLDLRGAGALSIGLAGVVFALIGGPGHQWPTSTIVAGALGGVGLAAFVVIERSVLQPMVPLSVFRSQQFSGANAVTFMVYAALAGVLFLLTVHLQQDLGYSALEAGASTLPITAMMLLFSARSGRLAQRIGPRIPMTAGPLVIAVAFVFLRSVNPGRSYVAGVFPGVLVLGAGLVLTVSPLTIAVLAAIDVHRAGVGSAINNAVSRVASLLAVATLPALAGVVGAGARLADGFARAMTICAGLAIAGAFIAWVSIRTVAPEPVRT